MTYSATVYFDVARTDFAEPSAATLALRHAIESRCPIGIHPNNTAFVDPRTHFPADSISNLACIDLTDQPGSETAEYLLSPLDFVVPPPVSLPQRYSDRMSLVSDCLSVCLGELPETPVYFIVTLCDECDSTAEMTLSALSEKLASAWNANGIAGTLVRVLADLSPHRNG